MSAPVCKNCRGPVEDLRNGYATPVCFACLKPSWQEAEIARLRAALQAIADRQPTQHVGETHRGERHDDKKSAYYCGVFDGRKDGLFEAAEMARAALGGGT